MSSCSHGCQYLWNFESIDFCWLDALLPEAKYATFGKWALPSFLSARFEEEIFKSESFMGPFRTHLAPQRLIQHLSRSLDGSLGCVCLVVMIHTHLQSVPASLFFFFFFFFLPHANRCNRNSSEIEVDRWRGNIRGGATGRSRWKEIRIKARGEMGEKKKTWKRGKKGMDGADEERDKREGGGEAEGGHCWCWNQRLEVESCENKSNLHHCSTELSTAFHLPPSKNPPTPPSPSFPTNSPRHSTALKWKTAFKGTEKKDI